MECEACESDEDFMNELENEYSEASGTDMDQRMRQGWSSTWWPRLSCDGDSAKRPRLSS